MKFWIFVPLVFFLWGCDEDYQSGGGGDGTACQCKSPDNGHFGSCGSINVSTETWSKQPDRDCADTTGGVTLLCCPGTIETVMTSRTEAFAGLDILERTTISHPVLMQGASFNLSDTGLPQSISCQAECEKSNSPYCVNVSGNQSEALTEAISLVTDHISAGQPEIEKRSFMDLFDIENDYCGRSNLAIDGNLLRNSGLSCQLDTEFRAGSLNLQSVTVAMPPDVSASWNPITPTEGFFEFGEDGQAPNIEIDGYLQQDFGGFIQRINVGETGVSIRTLNGCIGL